jgi:hypothetical protein
MNLEWDLTDNKGMKEALLKTLLILTILQVDQVQEVLLLLKVFKH